MHPILQKTFGGLSKRYYVREFIFGLMFPAIIILVPFFVLSSTNTPPLSMVIIAIINTIMYPYARFVYQSVMGFIMGGNVFAVNAILFLGVKLATMALCWAMAIFIAPIGLAYLYYHHSKNEKQA
jgi:hypothetical protein